MGPRSRNDSGPGEMAPVFTAPDLTIRRRVATEPEPDGTLKLRHASTGSYLDACRYLRQMLCWRALRSRGAGERR